MSIWIILTKLGLLLLFLWSANNCRGWGQKARSHEAGCSCWLSRDGLHCNGDVCSGTYFIDLVLTMAFHREVRPSPETVYLLFNIIKKDKPRTKYCLLSQTNSYSFRIFILFLFKDSINIYLLHHFLICSLILGTN